MDVSRRVFLKVTGTLTGIAALESSGISLLKKLTPGEAQAMEKGMAAYEVKYSADCMCPSECGLEFWVKDGKVQKIYGNPHVPFNDGIVCAKGASGMQLIYSPNRLKYPMIRTGERGEGKFKRVTWSEAIEYIGERLVKIKKEFGPEAIIMDTGDVTDRDQYWRLFFGFGTPNCVEHGSICDTPRRHGPKLMVGGKRWEPDLMRPVYVRQPDGSLKKDMSYKTKFILYCGWNPFVATRIMYENRGTVGAQVENGCKYYVIDPSYSNTASLADKWIAPRAGTDNDIFAAMLRYILENDNQNDPKRKYIDWDFKKYSKGWDEFAAAFKSWWGKKDPINGLSYFSVEWAAERAGITREEIVDLAHTFGITKPAAVIWGMQSPGHHYNGYPGSILGVALNVITGNFDAPGGVLDTEIMKWGKGGKGREFSFVENGKFNDRKVKRMVNGKEVEGNQSELNKDHYGSKYPAAWDDVVGDYPEFFEGKEVQIRYGAFRGYKYPIKAYILRTGNSVVSGSATWRWKEALTAKDAKGNYKLALNVFIDTLNLESALYADVILPEASYAERVSWSDIYPSMPLGYLRDAVIKPLHESKNPTEIMNLLAKKMYELGDRDIKPGDFWERYKDEDTFATDLILGTPGKPNIGTPLPYPQYPEGYTLRGTPDSLEKGDVKINHDKKEVVGEQVTPAWMRKNNGVAVWPMSWKRYKKVNSDEPNKVWPPTDSKMIEFVWDYKDGDKRKGRYSKYNVLIEKAGNEVPEGLKEIGFQKFPETFYWFETVWNPYTNPAYKKYQKDYPFQLITGRIHHSMTGTQMVPWLGEVKTEGLWQPLNNEFETDIPESMPNGTADAPMKTVKMKFKANTYSVGTIWMNTDDAKKLGLKTGTLVVVENPLGKSTKGKVYVSGGIRPGVVKIAFGSGGRFSPGMGAAYKSKDYTPDCNNLMDPKALSPIMGQTAYADMMIRIKKA